MKKHVLVIGVGVLFLCHTGTLAAGDIKGKVKARGAKHNGDAVIFIDKIPGKTFQPPKEHATMDQKNLVFIPHVLPVLVGTTVGYLNSDDVLHNVFTPDKCAEKFNLGTWPKGQVRSFTFKEPGCVPVMLCNVHPEMEAFVVVLENPYYAVSAKDGSYTIKNVPAGKYTLKIWHEKLKGESQEVTVMESGDIVVDFEIKR
ncbi:MAG: carboxypeptidase regulatory-like domain-containing protein [Bacteroidota bacterium]